MLIDTPGMRELQLWETGEAAGGDFRATSPRWRDGCRFRDCAHESGAGMRRGRRDSRRRARRSPARELSQAAD